jgi:Tol biopolymer transport system component
MEEPDRIDQATRPDSIVMVRDISNGQEREIGRFPAISRRISWTADGKSLVFPTTTTAGRNVLRVDVGSGKSEALIPAALTDSRSFYAYPQMSPDGRYLYYMQAPVSGVGARLMRLDLAQQQARQLATVHQFYALSPDGSQFVAPVADKNATVLRVLGPNGETRHDLITIAEPDLLTSFAWSPDGQQVFFSKTTRANRSSFFRIPASGGSPVSLGVQAEAFRDLSVHPNGGELAFVGVASDLEIWRLEGLSQSLAHALTPRTQAVHAKQ